jgi:RNA polymerase sigma-70 factor (ECF subfamily)
VVTDTTDAAVVERCLAGDTDAFGYLVEKYQGAVYATAFYYCRRQDAAEEIAQDAFLAAYRGLRNVRDVNNFGPWLKGVTCRTAANWLRKHGVRLRSETPLPYRRSLSIEDAREGPQGLFERGERFERIQEAIDALPERYRLPVVLRYLQELSYDEISTFIGASRDEIRGILQQASRLLKDLLADLGANTDGDMKWRRAHE